MTSDGPAGAARRMRRRMAGAFHYFWALVGVFKGLARENVSGVQSAAGQAPLALHRGATRRSRPVHWAKWRRPE
jgi:hypothetical protein